MRFPLLFFVPLGILLCVDSVRAQDVPTSDVLNAIIPQLRKKLPATDISFQLPINGKDPIGTCEMQLSNMTVARGMESHTFSVLIDPPPGLPIVPKHVLARITRLTVDADGSTRSYHPEDPDGEGMCKEVSQPDGSPLLQGICALDDISNAGIRLFLGTKRIMKNQPQKNSGGNDSDLAKAWTSVWPLIRDKTLRPVNFKMIIGGAEAPDGYYLFYWKQRELTVFFNENNIPRTQDGYPCLHAKESRFPGYFVTSTTLTHQGSVRADGCAPSHYIDAEQIPFFVLPGRSFGHVEIGDIVVGHIKMGSRERVVYGVAGDTGPFDQFGEGSIAFNRQLLGDPKVVMNAKSVEALDIDLKASEKEKSGTLAILILGGTKQLLDRNYSPQNIEMVGRKEFARWGGSEERALHRLSACVAAAPINP
jgi:hypothetical protein